MVQNWLSSIDNRYQMFLERKIEIKKQMNHLQDTLDMINFKCTYYKKAKELGTVSDKGLDKLRHESSSKSAYINDIVRDLK